MPDISPTRGEISRASAFANFERWKRERRRPKLPISPLVVGEMAGRPEGGAEERGLSDL
ncbi:MAG: propionyl-coenzyme A carboxylase alpha polypeptide [Mesorhizobium sp.]|nr:MAG: propionyl-coenzyme A carboxylase alpha polypeptide [Mesorhizobium sp.]